MIKTPSYNLQSNPFVVPTNDGKYIAEHFGNATDKNPNLSIARMIAPPGWSEPAQKPTFDEYTLVVRGVKQIEVGGETIILHAGESIHVLANNLVRYSNPFDQECEYVSICTPSFSFEEANRESEQ